MILLNPKLNSFSGDCCRNEAVKYLYDSWFNSNFKWRKHMSIVVDLNL